MSLVEIVIAISLASLLVNAVGSIFNRALQQYQRQQDLGLMDQQELFLKTFVKQLLSQDYLAQFGYADKYNNNDQILLKFAHQEPQASDQATNLQTQNNTSDSSFFNALTAFASISSSNSLDQLRSPGDLDHLSSPDPLSSSEPLNSDPKATILFGCNGQILTNATTLRIYLNKQNGLSCLQTAYQTKQTHTLLNNGLVKMFVLYEEQNSQNNRTKQLINNLSPQRDNEFRLINFNKIKTLRLAFILRSEHKIKAAAQTTEFNYILGDPKLNYLSPKDRYLYRLIYLTVPLKPEKLQ